MRRLHFGLAALFASLMLMIPFASPANAHGGTVYHGADWASIGADHNNGKVSDRECDGNYVFAELWLRNGNVVQRWHRNGCNTGAVSWSTVADVAYIAVCEGTTLANARCSSWQHHPQ